jgi:hypothetical protein
MIDFPDTPTTGDTFAAGGASWLWDGVKWTIDTSGGGLPVLIQGEVLGNPDFVDAAAIPADLALMLRASLGDGLTGQVVTSGGTGVDPAWADVATAGLPVCAQGEVLGNPGATSVPAVPASLEAMLRAALGDGVAGQVVTSGGTGVDPAWDDLPVVRYRIGFSFVGGVLAASQLLGMHPLTSAISIPANFGAVDGHASQAGGSANATASTVISVEKALAASPGSFSAIGTITFAAGSTTPTFATSGAVSFAIGDILRVVGPATADTTFANFYCTIVGQEL